VPVSQPGRSCPTSYRYGPRALRTGPSLEVDSVWIAGGLYGNPFALAALVEAYEGERGAKALVFNGDFHWFDVDAADFGRINDVVLAFHATRGNVETELATPQDGAGCGCGYPEWVDDGTVERSNRIIERLRATARTLPHTLAPLAALPMHLVVRVGDARVAVVHGDAASLAGWNFSQEALAAEGGLRHAREAFAAAGVDVFASSHTCLPVLQGFSGARVLVNNGAAGMPNFRGERYGLATRIALAPPAESIYGVRCGKLFVDAVPVRYDHAAWERRFVEQWPPGADAYESYFRRIVDGPQYARESALRLDVGDRATKVKRVAR
jgi:predicted phosphodiesterase